MKKLATLILLIISLIQTDVYAQTIGDINPDFDIIEQELSGFSTNVINFEIIYKQIKSGEIASAFRYLYNSVTQQLKNELIYYKNIMLTIFAVCLLSLMLNIFSDISVTKTNDQIIVFFVSGILIDIFSAIYNSALNTVNNIINFINASIPVYFAVTSVLSQKLPISVYNVFVTFVAVFEWIATNIMFPLLLFMFICTILSFIYPDFNFLSIKKFISGFIRTVLGFYTTFFVLGLKITQTVTYTTQKLVLTGIQYTVSKGVPVIGGFLSETAEALFSSVILLHNSVGITSIFVIIVLLFAPFLITFFVSVFLKLMCAIISPFSETCVINLVSNASDCITELAIVLLCAGVTFIIALSTEFITVR